MSAGRWWALHREFYGKHLLRVGVEEHVRVSLIFAIIVSFMLFTVFTLVYVIFMIF